jgi:hypothetical protein
LLAANRVNAAHGVDPEDAQPREPKTWRRKATQLSLECDDECFWFELSPLS